jgi:hypothetical protein
MTTEDRRPPSNSAPDDLPQSDNASIREVYEIKDALMERVVKVETIVKIGFPAVAAYITLLKFVPSSTTQAPLKSVGAVITAIANLF